MRSIRMQVFLSCSFDAADSDVVDFFTSLCRGVDIQCVNVDRGHSATPPSRARQLISDSQAMIAVATRKEEFKPGIFNMPKAVYEEMSMAYAMQKPILLFCETGVDTTAGFVRNYCTYQEFDRATIWTPAFLEKAVASIHTAKVDAISPLQLQLEQQGQEHVYAQSARWLMELVGIPPSHTWRYSATRRLMFTARFTDPIKAGAWATVQAEAAATPMPFKWSQTISDGNRAFQFRPKVERLTNECCELSLYVNPPPDAGDFLEYSTMFESPYLSPTFLDEVKDPRTTVIVNGRTFLCYEGIISIMRCQELQMQLRLPKFLGLGSADVAPFVGSYTNKVDYLVESEIKRMSSKTTTYGGNVVVDIFIQSPLPQHVYGVAWTPPKRP